MLTLALLSCKVKNEPTTPPQPTNPPKPTSDIEVIDTIPIELDYSDSLITPGMPMVARWPLQYEIFDSHFVIFIDSLSPRVAELTLLSLKDWSKIYSSLSEEHPTQATDTAARYIEFGLVGWSIPSETLARRMKSDIDPEAINAKLAAVYADEFHIKDGSSNARYLCEEATKTFSLAESTKITTAGAKTKYHLRLVKTQRVARQCSEISSHF